MVQTNNVRELFAKRLAQASRDAGFDDHGKATEIANKLGVTTKAVSKWFNAESLPRQEVMNKLAKLLSVDIVWLQHGQENVNNANVSNPRPYRPAPKYPVISFVQAGNWTEACEPYTLSEIDEWYESEVSVQGSAFWLKVEGDSMTAPTGVSIPEGSLVLVDTGREPINGSLVIAKLTDTNEATFKKLVLDGAKYLKALNPAYPVITINGNCKIIGVVVQMMMRFV
ncbi:MULTISPECIES: LexA family protein [Proteus]|uniref:LexA family protein n=1 Tax=Proteus TaxID=583 RepID=UPI000664E93E|nr:MULTISPECIES: S24 family peptidase [Proteus]EKU4148000.1 helix-turn-helix domain-containing protein [Proteus mirabilis]EKV0743708.1 helix-turn-helix domain-containing protein [Proteus mirabilis]EKV4203251.1 helix-turn-helix domain-containing protein [Proteus mirabilis]EKV5023609.1 helix-turn-helix domain-containing protein [Proteus mirabilis]EKV5440039.1 helix-turn-helix domain-containing protein [Proteus mirabilis]